MALSPTERAPRAVNYRVLGEVLVLGGTATLVLSKWLHGQLDFYIHPRYITLSIFAAVVLILMAIVRLQGVLATQRSDQVSWGALLLATPLLLGTLVPAQPLGASTLAERGLSAPAAAPASWAPPARSDTASWNLLEWSYAVVTRGEALRGEPADVIGFVYAAPELGADRFYISRYVVTCCAADGAGVGMPVVWAGGEALQNDSWVRVRGSIDTTSVAGVSQLAILATQVEPVAEPDFPYLYP